MAASPASTSSMENYGEYLFFGGLGLIFLASLWLLVRAFKTHKAWGFGSLVVIPLIVFAVLYRRQLKAPLFLLVLGLIVFAVPFAFPLYERYVIGFGPREKMVDGELHLTLTDWDRKSYFMLADKPDTVVLQMANPDVTDETLIYVAAMKELRELDINHTQVTDEGLAHLKDLTKLHKLFLQGTHITDEGFRTYIMPMESLDLLDLQDTRVTKETIKAWRAAKPKRRALQKNNP